MHKQLLSIGRFTFSLALLPTLLLPNFTPSTHALGCVNLDLSNQIKITGSKDNPGVQQNNIKQEIGPNCVGNTTVHNTTQLYVGADGANQIRNSEQFSGGLGKNPVLPAGVMDAGNVNIQVGTATSVYNPALDPKFLPKK
jgi:hypothetical protein